MASRTFFGNYKVYWVPDGVNDLAAPTTTELSTGTRIERLLADGGFTYTANEGNVSQDLLDEGKTSEDVGIRSVTGLSVTWELDFDASRGVSNDANWSLWQYNDRGTLVVIPDGALEGEEDETDLAGALAHTFQVSAHDPRTVAPSGNSKQNATVTFAVQDWAFDAQVTVGGE